MHNVLFLCPIAEMLACAMRVWEAILIKIYIIGYATAMRRKTGVLICEFLCICPLCEVELSITPDRCDMVNKATPVVCVIQPLTTLVCI